MKRLLIFALSLLPIATPALSCLDDLSSLEEVPKEVVTDFSVALDGLNNKAFRKKFCAFEAGDKQLSLRLFGSASHAVEGKERATLVRLSIMIPDIRENVVHVSQTGEIREVDDEWESIGIMRLIEHMVVRFPTSKSILSEAYIAETQALFDAALEAVAAREDKSDEEITLARQAISAHEREIKELMGQIQALRDKRRKYRTMRQELELQVR